jgi:type VI secretion system protein ImpH
VIREIEKNARRFEFAQLARLLARLDPERERVGGDADPSRESARFRSDASFAFPISDVVSVSAPERDGDPPQVTVAFLGVATQASFGSLPMAYSVLIQEQQREKSTVLREFLDCFNHRLISLYFRAYAKYQPTVSADVTDDDAFAATLKGLLGLATGEMCDRLGLPSEGLFGRAGLLGMQPLPAVALESVLESYFRVPARVEQFLPTWYELAVEDRSCLGSAHATLGHDLALGARVRLHQFRFRVRLGPLTLEQYCELLPDADGFEALFDVVRLSTTAEQTFEVQLVLDRGAVPSLALGAGSPCRLGWTSWLTLPGRAHDADDAVFASETSAQTRRRPRARRGMNLENAA